MRATIKEQNLKFNFLVVYAWLHYMIFRLWYGSFTGLVNRLVTKHEAIMLQKLSIMLLSCVQKITYYGFENCPLFPKLCHPNWLIMPPFALMFKLQIVWDSLGGCCTSISFQCDCFIRANTVKKVGYKMVFPVAY